MLVTSGCNSCQCSMGEGAFLGAAKGSSMQGAVAFIQYLQNLVF